MLTENEAGGAVMARGFVKWFNNAKGFGFITQNEVADDIFVHYSQIQGDGFKTLRQGENVEFELCTGDKGLHAENVVREGDVDA
jgi:CspA family cold shock protein